MGWKDRIYIWHLSGCFCSRMGGLGEMAEVDQATQATQAP